jgi:hypothetical protein
VHAKVPNVTADEQRDLQLANAQGDERLWSSLRDLHEGTAADQGLWGCLSQSNIDGVPSAQPDIAPVDQLPDLGFQLTLVFNAGRRSVNLDHPVGTMATNANLALAEVRTQNFLDAAIALRSHSYFA